MNLLFLVIPTILNIYYRGPILVPIHYYYFLFYFFEGEGGRKSGLKITYIMTKLILANWFYQFYA